jgi:hypothetical protein
MAKKGKYVPIGDRYLQAEARFKRKYRTDKKLVSEVDKLLDLATSWYAVVMVNVHLELAKRNEFPKQRESRRSIKRSE